MNDDYGGQLDGLSMCLLAVSDSAERQARRIEQEADYRSFVASLVAKPVKRFYERRGNVPGFSRRGLPGKRPWCGAIKFRVRNQ